MSATRPPLLRAEPSSRSSAEGHDDYRDANDAAIVAPFGLAALDASIRKGFRDRQARTTLAGLGVSASGPREDIH